MVPKSGLQHPAQLAFEIPAYPPITDHSPCLGSWQLSSLFRDPSLQYHLATRRVTLCLTLQTVTRLVTLHQVFPGGSVIKKKKKSACNAGASGDTGSILGLGRSPGGGNDSPLQCSCLENPMDRGVWWATVPKELDTTEQLTTTVIS